MSHLKRARWRVVSLCAVSVMFALEGAGLITSGASAARVSASAAAGAKITTAWPSDVTSLDPANLSTNEDHALSRNIYQTLLLPDLVAQPDATLKFSGQNVKPYLASS